MTALTATGVTVAEMVGLIPVTYSESQSDRAVLALRGPDGHAATVIIMRRRAQVWLVFNGAEKTTVAMTDAQAYELIEAVRTATRGQR